MSVEIAALIITVLGLLLVAWAPHPDAKTCGFIAFGVGLLALLIAPHGAKLW